MVTTLKVDMVAGLDSPCPRHDPSVTVVWRELAKLTHLTSLDLHVQSNKSGQSFELAPLSGLKNLALLRVSGTVKYMKAACAVRKKL